MFFDDRDHAAQRLIESRQWEEPGTIVPMLRGGYPIALPLIEHFPKANVAFATIKMPHITQIGAVLVMGIKKPEVSIDGELKGDILLIDDGVVVGNHARAVLQKIRAIGKRNKVSLAVPAIFPETREFLKADGFHNIFAARELKKNWATGALYFSFPDVVVPKNIWRKQ